LLAYRIIPLGGVAVKGGAAVPLPLTGTTPSGILPQVGGKERSHAVRAACLQGSNVAALCCNTPFIVVEPSCAHRKVQLLEGAA